MKLGTQVIHSGEPDPKIAGAVAMPIFQSSVFETAEEEDYHNIKYIRLSNTPNHIAVHEKLAALEGAESALVTASGMAAITTTLLSFLSPGDHLITQDSLYAGTPNFLNNEGVRFGITHDIIDINDPNSWKSKLRRSTKVLYIETIANPLLRVPDFRTVIKFAHENGLLAIIDNTFATPINFRPLEWGFDISLHSCTKFLNGHSDLVAGAVIGRSDLVERVYHTLVRMGGTLNPISCFLLHRALKTLAVRIRRHNENAVKIASFLDSHPLVSRVFYPGLDSDPSHAIAREYLDGFGGVISFEVNGGLPVIERLFSRLQLAAIAPSLGGVETSITRPAATSHYCISAAERLRMGVKDNLLRLSVGIEEAEDLISDIAAALVD